MFISGLHYFRICVCQNIDHFASHVHETIQPVIYKEVIQPNVIHTTVPVHEVHHNAARHHTTSTLPAVTIDEFKKSGGVLGGSTEQTRTHSATLNASHSAINPGHKDGDMPNQKKPSLLDKLNPRKDADGNGKKGFLD
jgi:hypothetical protein